MNNLKKRTSSSRWMTGQVELTKNKLQPRNRQWVHTTSELVERATSFKFGSRTMVANLTTRWGAKSQCREKPNTLCQRWSNSQHQLQVSSRWLKTFQSSRRLTLRSKTAIEGELTNKRLLSCPNSTVTTFHPSTRTLTMTTIIIRMLLHREVTGQKRSLRRWSTPKTLRSTEVSVVEALWVALVAKQMHLARSPKLHDTKATPASHPDKSTTALQIRAATYTSTRAFR